VDDARDEELAELLAEVRRIDVQASRLVTSLMAGEYTSVFRGSGLEFDGVREYEEGDDPRTVDWNVTARVGRPFVKMFVDERELTVLFLLDLSESMGGGFGVWSARQAAARICACLSLAAIRNNDKVGLIAFSDEVERYVAPNRGVGHVLRIVRDCLALRGRSGGTSVGAALDYAGRLLRRRSVLFLVSDFLAEGWQDEIDLCSRRHDLIAVRLLPPELEDLGGGGLVRLADPETGRETVVDTGSARVRAWWKERVAAWRDRTTTSLRRARVDIIDVPMSMTLDPNVISRPILSFFRMREMRGAKR